MFIYFRIFRSYNTWSKYVGRILPQALCIDNIETVYYNEEIKSAKFNIDSLSSKRLRECISDCLQFLSGRKIFEILFIDSIIKRRYNVYIYFWKIA